MEYKVEISKKFSHIKIYKVKKRINDNTNKVSRMMQSLIDKYLTKTEEKGAQ